MRVKLLGFLSRRRIRSAASRERRGMGASGGGEPAAPAASTPPSPPPQKPTDPATWLLTVLAGAVAGGITAAITNSLTAAFEHSPLLLFGVLGAGVLIAGLVYFRRDLHRAL